jgi:hypothetical protein
MMLQKLEIKQHRDEDGNHVVSVPLTNTDKTVKLFQEDFDRLMRSGLDPRWRLSNGEVFERGRSRLSIKRLIADAAKGEKVQLLDGDPCNLRRDNLITTPGGGKYKARDKLGYMERPHRFLNRVELKRITIPASWEAHTAPAK